MERLIGFRKQKKVPAIWRIGEATLLHRMGV